MRASSTKASVRGSARLRAARGSPTEARHDRAFAPRRRPHSGGKRASIASFRSATFHPGAFVLRFSREGLAFRAGQWVNLGLPRGTDRREYTLYSSPRMRFLEVLVKEIPEGRLSPALRLCRPGDELEVDGPHGSFSIVQGSRSSARFLFVATGTGVSPFHCFVRD